MADNSSIPVASGNETFANKDIGGVKHPKHIIVDSSGVEVVGATAANQTTGNTSLATIATNTTGAATASKQDTGNTSIAAVNTVLGAKTDAKSTATDTTSVSAMQVLKQISASVQGTLTVAAHAVTQSGSWVISAGSALIGKVTISDGTSDVSIKAASTAATASDKALVVIQRPDGLADIFGEKEEIAASATDQVLGATGATGDYLSHVIIVPLTAAAGAVSYKDGAGSSKTLFAGGGTTALPTLAAMTVGCGFYSTAGAFSITTGTNVEVIAVGSFT